MENAKLTDITRDAIEHFTIFTKCGNNFNCFIGRLCHHRIIILSAVHYLHVVDTDPSNLSPWAIPSRQFKVNMYIHEYLTLLAVVHTWYISDHQEPYLNTVLVKDWAPFNYQFQGLMTGTLLYCRMKSVLIVDRCLKYTVQLSLYNQQWMKITKLQTPYVLNVYQTVESFSSSVFISVWVTLHLSLSICPPTASPSQPASMSPLMGISHLASHSESSLANRLLPTN